MNQLPEKQVKILPLSTLNQKKLIVINDHFNTFGHVIKTLVQVCQHTEEQAEQCAWIIHHKGQCVVKEGILKNIQPMYQLIRKAGIQAEIL